MRAWWIVVGAAAAAISVAGEAATVQKVAPATLEPQTGYVLVRLGERSPDLWNTLTLAAYDDAAQDVRGKGRAKTNPVAKGQDAAVTIGPKSFLAEEGHVRTYLVAVTPGRYVIQNGPTTCFCLGSYQFDVAPGRITDMGTIYLGPENGTSPWAQIRALHSAPDIEARGYTVADAMAVLPAGAAAAVPPVLAALPRAPARYLPATRFGNHQGQLLNRALPLEVKP